MKKQKEQVQEEQVHEEQVTQQVFADPDLLFTAASTIAASMVSGKCDRNAVANIATLQGVIAAVAVNLALQVKKEIDSRQE